MSGSQIARIKFTPREDFDIQRVAAYARVSSGKDAMLQSLAAQISYYSELIQKHRGWEYVGVYADEAKTGTKDSRENFQRLIVDCRAGKIDMVITKSISRFARNTVTLRCGELYCVTITHLHQNVHIPLSEGNSTVRVEQCRR